MTLDIIGINVGGEKTIQVKRSLLTQECIRGSWLEVRFSSGHWEQDGLDADGHYFIDNSPEVVMPFIQWLRECRDALPGVPAMPPYVCATHRSAWVKFMLTLGLPHETAVRRLRCAGVTLAECKAIYNPIQLREGGFNIFELIREGFDVIQIKDAGFSASEMKDAGFSFEQLIEVGFDACQMKDAGFSGSQLREAGFSACVMKDAGFSTYELQIAGFSASQMKAAGFSAADMRQGRFSAAECLAAQFSVSQLRDAGFDESSGL